MRHQCFLKSLVMWMYIQVMWSTGSYSMPVNSGRVEPQVMTSSFVANEATCWFNLVKDQFHTDCRMISSQNRGINDCTDPCRTSISVPMQGEPNVVDAPSAAWCVRPGCSLSDLASFKCGREPQVILCNIGSERLGLSIFFTSMMIANVFGSLGPNHSVGVT